MPNFMTILFQTSEITWNKQTDTQTGTQTDKQTDKANYYVDISRYIDVLHATVAIRCIIGPQHNQAEVRNG